MLRKYQSLAQDYHLMYRMPVVIVLVVVGCTGIVSSNCISHLRCIPEFSNNLSFTIQKAAIIGTVHVLRCINMI